MTVKITELRPRLKYFKLFFIQEINKESAVKIFDAFFKKLDIPDDKEIQKAKKVLATYEMNDKTEYTINMSTGWAKKFNSVRRAGTASQLQTEQYKIEERKL